MKIRSEETKSGAAGEIVNQREQQAGKGEAAEGHVKCVGGDVVARGKKGVRR